MRQEQEHNRKKEYKSLQALYPADILLPAKDTDLGKWAVIACDQFTSQPEYWREAEDFVGDAPSALRLIYPEVYLEREDQGAYCGRIREIHRQMERYLESEILSRCVRQGYVLTVRETEAGVRAGLLAALDLETYDYRPEFGTPVRATEETVPERIPARVGIRQGAPLELPHVMMLLNDAKKELLKPLYENRARYPKLYDTELMLGGGRIAGYALEGEAAEQVTETLRRMQERCGEIFLAVGDGNHSLAAAKACWEAEKQRLAGGATGSPSGSRNDAQTSCRTDGLTGRPARYALTEVVDLYSDSLEFHPIHRVLYGGRLEELTEGFAAYLKGQEIGCEILDAIRESSNASDGGKAVPGDLHMDQTEGTGVRTQTVELLQGNRRQIIRMKDAKGHLAVELLQKYLDGYLAGTAKAAAESPTENLTEAAQTEAAPVKQASGLRLDYVHDRQAAERCAAEEGACAMLLGALDKRELFPAIAAGGVLPRKTFSIGRDIEKRYYMECRRLRD